MMHRSKVSDTVNIRGVLIDRVDMGEALSRIEGFIGEGRPHRIVTVNLDYLRHSRKDEHFREAVNSADLAVADGAPLVWASRLFGHPLPERVAGVDLADRCAELAAARSYRLFLLGAGPGVAEGVARVLEQKYPGLRIAGTYTPPFGDFSEEEEQRIRDRIRQARPDILLVGLPTPRQELWNHGHAADWGVPVTIGVGAAFDMLGGLVPRAPRWMQRSGLEWLFRLWIEPRRLWKRYLLHDSLELVRLAAGRLTLRRDPNNDDARTTQQRANTVGMK
jgi:N-acetylglucosaminyldiphosphoundecaprenol N-acetyl-beta-D-mannosaminyltransferase